LEKVNVERGQPSESTGVLRLQSSAGISSVIFGVRNLSFSIYLGNPFINLGPAVIGLLFTVSQVTGAVCAIPIGVLADRLGRKKFIVLSRFLQAVGFLPLIFFTDVPPIFMGMLLLDTGSAVASAPFSALLADKSPLEKRNSVFSHNYVAISVGSAIGSAASMIPPYLRDNYGFGGVQSYNPLFIILFLVGLASLVVISTVHEDKASKESQLNAQERRKTGGLESANKILKYSLTMVLIQIGAGMIVQLFSLWLSIAFGVNELELGPLYVAINLSMGAGYYLANWLATLMGSVRSIVVTQFMATVLLVVLPNIPSFQIVGIVYILRTALMNMSSPILTSFVCGIVPANERASALSISNSAGAIARAAGPALGGYEMTLSLALPFYICGAMYGVSTVIFYTFFKRTKPGECDQSSSS
jgi:MFS family permease